MRPAPPRSRFRSGLRVVALLAATAATAALPAMAADDAASAAHVDKERAQIAAERAGAEARFSSSERECLRHFVVTSCVDDAKRLRRESLDRLRDRQHIVDEAQRHERAAERRQELGDKAADDARRDAERASHGAASAASNAAPSAMPGAASDLAAAPRRPLSPEPGQPKSLTGPDRAASGSGSGRGRPKPSGQGAGPVARPVETPQARQDREARSRAAYVRRQAEAAEHRTEATDRAARRAAAKPPSASLPVPGASSASASSR